MVLLRRSLCTRCTDDWVTDLIPIGAGVPQGCTASTINFGSPFQLLLDFHSALLGGTIERIGYRIANSSVVVSTLIICKRLRQNVNSLSMRLRCVYCGRGPYS